MLAWLGAGQHAWLRSRWPARRRHLPRNRRPTPDAFAVVRATSQAAYQAGQTTIAQGDYLQACVDFDTARTTDPDNST